MRQVKRKHIITIIVLIALGVLVYLFLSRKFEPNIVSVVPENGAKEITLKSSIDITFFNSVPESEQQKFFVRIVPGIPTTSVWISPKLLRIIPQAEYTPLTTYNISILFEGEEVRTSSFETKFVKVYTTEETEEIRTMAFESAAAFYQLDATYPFLRKLPVETDSFRVVFDFDRDEFRVRLKMPQNAPEETRQEAETAALTALSSVGIDVNEYGYYVLFSDN